MSEIKTLRFREEEEEEEWFKPEERLKKNGTWEENSTVFLCFTVMRLSYGSELYDYYIHEWDNGDHKI